MTHEQITKWAVEAGTPTVSEFGYTRLASPKQLQAFTKLVRNATLEEAAKRCDEIWQHDGTSMECRDYIMGMKS